MELFRKPAHDNPNDITKAAAMAEVQMLEMMAGQQIEAEIEAEVEAQIEAEMALEASGASYDGAAWGVATGSDGAVSTETASVDVSI